MTNKNRDIRNKSVRDLFKHRQRLEWYTLHFGNRCQFITEMKLDPQDTYLLRLTVHEIQHLAEMCRIAYAHLHQHNQNIIMPPNDPQTGDPLYLTSFSKERTVEQKEGSTT